VEKVYLLYSLVSCIDCAIAQAVSRRLLSKEACVHSQGSLYEICGVQSGLGQGILRVLMLSPVTIVPPLLRIHSSVTWGMDNGPISVRSSTET
jgi:hypothetical protein